MAIVPSTKYSGRIDTSDPTGYPHGKAKNVTVTGDGTGTPLEKDWVNDVFGFQQALLDAGGVTPSGTADKVGASDYLDALVEVIDTHTFTADVVANNDVFAGGNSAPNVQLDGSAGDVLASNDVVAENDVFAGGTGGTYCQLDGSAGLIRATDGTASVVLNGTTGVVTVTDGTDTVTLNPSAARGYVQASQGFRLAAAQNFVTSIPMFDFVFDRDNWEWYFENLGLRSGLIAKTPPGSAYIGAWCGLNGKLPVNCTLTSMVIRYYSDGSGTKKVHIMRRALTDDDWASQHEVTLTDGTSTSVSQTWNHTDVVLDHDYEWAIAVETNASVTSGTFRLFGIWQYYDVQEYGP